MTHPYYADELKKYVTVVKFDDYNSGVTFEVFKDKAAALRYVREEILILGHQYTVPAACEAIGELDRESIYQHGHRDKESTIEILENCPVRN
jgi:hypothetical protein